MDVTNPGVVTVASETYGNPNPNGGITTTSINPSNVLVPAADTGYPPARNSVASSVFPTPDDVDVDQLPVLPPPGSSSAPPVPNIFVDDQVLGQGTWQYADPANHALGKVFVEPADFVVVGPADSFQTNATELDEVSLTVTAVYDADNLYHAPSGTTTRYYLVVATPPALTSYPVSLLGRQVVFADDTLTTADQGAARGITGFGTNFVVINRDDPSESNGDVPTLTAPQVGDVLTLDVARLGSEQVKTTSLPVANVVVDQTPYLTPRAPQSAKGGAFTNQSTGPQPAPPIVPVGTAAPTAVNVFIANQDAVVGLPTNVYV